jgi:hypothetical protein
MTYRTAMGIAVAVLSGCSSSSSNSSSAAPRSSLTHRPAHHLMLMAAMRTGASHVE